MTFKDKIKNFFKKLWQIIKKCALFIDNRPALESIILGVTLNLITEILHRHSLVEAIVHICTKPLPFLFNSLMIITSIAICTLFKRKYFWISLISAIWLAMGIINGVVLLMRVTPFEWTDLAFVKFSLIQIYLSNIEIVLVISAILLAVALLIVFFIKGPKAKVNYIKSGITSAVSIFLLVICLLVFRRTGILMSDHVKNLANAYLDYGFNYCFMCSVFDVGIDKPSQYESGDIENIMIQLENAADNNNEVNNAATNWVDGQQKPNIIFLQLETFFDVQHLSGMKFSENPIPVFTELQNKYSTGYLAVPSIGAGTANTEFEVIAGMSLDYFGMGEYPYKTVLKKTAVESVCYNLANHGYTSHAIHNNNATFYDRNEVFANLGFDTFTSMEYMQDLEFTITGWAKDDVLITSITDALESTEGADCVYTISVQSHGKYPSIYDDNLEISVSGIEDDTLAREYAYYINQLHEVDTIIGELLEILSEREEDTIVVIYGDHLPSFDIKEEDLSNGDLFQTEYVIWDNIGLERQYKDLSAYQLYATVLGRIGIDTGVLTKLHQNFSSDDKYEEWLELLMYDAIYGEKYSYNGKVNYPYKTKNLQLGVKEITISDVIPGEKITIKGANFTAYSTVFYNDDKMNTKFVDSSTLIIDETVKFKAGDCIAVGQIDKNNNFLSFSKAYLIGGTTDNPSVYPDPDNVVYVKKGISLSTLILLIVASAALVSAITITAVHFLYRKKHTAAKK